MIVEEHSIVCNRCGKDTGLTEEQFKYMVLFEDVLCPHCFGIVIAIVKPQYNHKGKPTSKQTLMFSSGTEHVGNFRVFFTDGG